MAQDPEGPQAAAFFDRVRESGGFLRRAADVTHVPFSQAVKAVAFLAAMTPKTVWAAERRARRVVPQLAARASGGAGLTGQRAE